MGKTSLLIRYIENKFDPNQEPTMPRSRNSIPFLEKIVELEDDTKVKLSLWVKII